MSGEDGLSALQAGRRSTNGGPFPLDPFPELRPNKARCLKFSRRRDFSVLFLSSPLRDGKWGAEEHVSLVCVLKSQEHLNLILRCGLIFSRETFIAVFVL